MRKGKDSNMEFQNRYLCPAVDWSIGLQTDDVMNKFTLHTPANHTLTSPSLPRPHLQSRNFMDALLAFWPGLQVLLGDVRPAVETHEMLYQVMQRHTFIPEAFTQDFQVSCESFCD